MKTLLLILAILFTFASYAETFPVLKAYPDVKDKNIGLIKKNKVLVFINRTCPCTQQNIPYINKLVKEFPELEFIGVHSKKNGTLLEIKEVIENYQPDFPIVDDSNLLIANFLKANRTPQAFILNEYNNILYNGGVTDRTNPSNAKIPYLRNALLELSSHKEITEKETRSLGCVIIR